MINPKLLCRKHLLGEHNEIHKHKHNFEKGHKIDGRLKPFVAIEPLNMGKRHNQLVKEMINRGYNHNSPYKQPNLSKYDFDKINVKANINFNLDDLISRCDECKKLILNQNER